jgi:hypothetical protein
MSALYCVLCERLVIAKRKFGLGTIIMLFVTSFFWIVMLPLYAKRCPICNGTTLLSVKRAKRLKKLKEITNE